MRRLFKLTAEYPLSYEATLAIQQEWEHAIQGTDLEGAKLLILQDGLNIDPLSEGALLKEAADSLDRRGKHVYAAELRRLASGG